MILRSVRSRVIALAIGTAVVTAAATGWLATSAAERAVKSNAERSLEVDTSILDSLSAYSLTNGSWDGVQTLVGELSRDTGRRIALTDMNGLLLVDSDQVLGDTPRALPTTPAARIDAGRFTGVFPAIAIGTTQSVPAPSPADVSDATACLQAAEVPFQIEVVDGVTAVVPADALDDDSFVQYAQCTVPLNEVTGAVATPWPGTGDTVIVGGAQATPVDTGAPVAAPSALLYLGTRSEGTLLFRGPTAWRTVWLLAAVVAAAAAGAWLLGRRLTRPLVHLTEAARRMEAGELGHRVQAGRDEVGQLGHAFNSLADSMQRTEALRQQMVTDIAHELRNPLVTLGGTLEAIQDGIYQPSPDVIASLADETTHLQRLVGDLHDLSVADAVGLRLDRIDTDLVELLDTIHEAHRSLAAGASVTLSSVGPGGSLPRLAIDAGRIRQAVGNLLANAIRHATTSVTMSLDIVTDGVQICVADDGPGIPVDHLDDVFERFWRTDSARARATGGTGLGLAISRELVRAHGGELTVHSTVGEGARFIITLPAPTASSS